MCGWSQSNISWFKMTSIVSAFTGFRFQRYPEECVSDPSFGNLNLFSVSKLEKLADDGATQHPPFARINTPLVNPTER